jgi:S-formylglutathione hydrolase
MMEIKSSHRIFGGELSYAVHDSEATGTPMRLTIFLPPGDGPHPYVIWLSGLTCTEDNFTAKAGAYRAAADAGLSVIVPDTSPRGEGVADDPAYDLGQGAGFYVDATRPPWARHFRMYSYVTRDLIETIESEFPLDGSRRGILGHSMGGHGALTIALRNPNLFRSVSAFAPIVSPLRCPWGVKAMSAYMGPDREAWRVHDAVNLIEDGAAIGRFDEIFIDQGLADPFLESQLKPDLLRQACAAAGQPLRLRLQAGYDHSYFFIATFIAEHLAFHAERLR